MSVIAVPPKASSDMIAGKFITFLTHLLVLKFGSVPSYKIFNKQIYAYNVRFSFRVAEYEHRTDTISYMQIQLA